LGVRVSKEVLLNSQKYGRGNKQREIANG
jgi:hypothetical protein